MDSQTQHVLARRLPESTVSLIDRFLLDQYRRDHRRGKHREQEVYGRFVLFECLYRHVFFNFLDGKPCYAPDESIRMIIETRISPYIRTKITELVTQPLQLEGKKF